MTERPEFTHKRERHGLIGPFGGRQLAGGFALIVLVVIILVAITTPLGTAGNGLAPVDPQATAFVIGPAPAQGLRPGDIAPELTVTRSDGKIFQLTDLNGQPITLASLRGKGVWLNFWASWCPPCQSETPILRDLSERYRDQGLDVVGVSVQETQPSDVAAYAAKYQLTYTIGFDASGDVFHEYKVYALPTQFFITPEGVIRDVVQGPLTEAGAISEIERILPGGPSSAGTSPSVGPGSSASPSASVGSGLS
jgi:peroxiredoxin